MKWIECGPSIRFSRIHLFYPILRPQENSHWKYNGLLTEILFSSAVSLHLPIGSMNIHISSYSSTPAPPIGRVHIWNFNKICKH